jgi:hypothetical protein
MMVEMVVEQGGCGLNLMMVWPDPTIGTRTTVPECTLTLNAGDKSYPLPGLLKRVVEFWQKELRP